MSWFPHFLSPLSAAIAAAVCLPLLLLLYFLKLRRREMPVSSTFLWKKAVQDLQVNAPFQRLRRNLLLLLQMLLLLALIIALSRPVANFKPSAGKMSVILIDRSASMSAADMPSGKTRLDEAKREATDLVNGMERGGKATVIAFDDEPEIMQTFTANASALKSAIERIEPTDRRTKLGMAFQLAEAQAAYLPESNQNNIRPEVYLYSDGRVSDAKDLRLQADLKYQKIGTDSGGNIAIVAMNARRDYDQPVSVQVFARLENFGNKPVTADVRLKVDGKDRSIAGVTLAPANDPDFAKTHPEFVARDSVEFRVDMPAAGTIKVEQLNKTNDMLAADDSAVVVVPPPKDLSVLLVTKEHDNPYMEKVFATMGVKDAQVMLEDEYEEKQPKNFDVIIFDRVFPTWMPESGNYMYFGCTPTNGKLHVVKDGETFQTIEDCTVLDWQRDDPMLRPLQLGSLYVGSMLKLDMPADAKVLIEGLKGPMLVLDREGRNTNLVCAFDLLQSNWPLKKSFPIFIHAAVHYLALGSEMNVRPSFEPGATPRIPRTNLDKLGPDLKSIQLSGPMGSRSIPIPASGDFVLPALNKVGLYKTDPPVPQFEQIAVNLLDDNESDLMPADAPPGNVGVAVATGTGKSRLELWWWLVACGALPLLLIEWWVYTRRVHL